MGAPPGAPSTTMAIQDTDVKSYYWIPGNGNVQMTTQSTRIKGFEMHGLPSSQPPMGIEFYDGTSDSGTANLRHYFGGYRGVYFPEGVVMLPGNGMRFDQVYLFNPDASLNDTTDAAAYVSIFYQT